MKKWIVGIVLLAMVVGESSCLVRTKAEHPRRRHHTRTVVVY